MTLIYGSLVKSSSTKTKCWVDVQGDMQLSQAGFHLRSCCVDPLLDGFDTYFIFFSIYSHYCCRVVLSVWLLCLFCKSMWSLHS